ncbi:MAG TPA: DinB family protein [Candidatus Angelobacter sp.]
MGNEAAALQQQIADVRRRANELVSGLSPEQLTRRPDPSRWSIAECVAHLNLAAGVMQPMMIAGIDRGKKRKVYGQGPFNPGLRGGMLMWIAEPPPKFRLPAPKLIAPPATISDPATVFSDFMGVQDEWERLLKAAEGVDQSKIALGRWWSPFYCRLSAAFPWMMAHQRRHLLQAENVKRQIVSAASGSSAKAG